jgi:ATP-dependent 26S proteasome regulatory subunit
MSGGGWVGHMGFGTGDEEGEEDKAWRVLVLEDTGELLSADARASMGQGLSRFLNLVDGLIGQGLRVLVLVTTNEEVRRLHPAVARPGRCAANIQFEPLTAEEASRWLEQHGRPAGAGGRRTLASLYAELEGRDLTEMALVGFGS